jgi:hypothetical protein
MGQPKEGTAVGSPVLGFSTVSWAQPAGADQPESARPTEARDRYVLIERAGEGAMGVVYAAYDRELDRKVALKVLRAETAKTSAQERLRREAQAMARLAHPWTRRQGGWRSPRRSSGPIAHARGLWRPAFGMSCTGRAATRGSSLRPNGSSPPSAVEAAICGVRRDAALVQHRLSRRSPMRGEQRVVSHEAQHPLPRHAHAVAHAHPPCQPPGTVTLRLLPG